jgi:arsenate reductase
MAEELLRLRLGNTVHVESAGLEPGVINPIVIDVLKTKGIDISAKKTRSVYDLIKSGSTFDYVITVCDETSGEMCPVFPGVMTRMHWSIPDPSAFQGTYQERFEKTKEVMRLIEAKLTDFIPELIKHNS